MHFLAFSFQENARIFLHFRWKMCTCIFNRKSKNKFSDIALASSKVFLWKTNQRQWQIQGALLACTPHGSRFFHYDIQIFRNVVTSGVGVPLWGWRPPMGILDLLLRAICRLDTGAGDNLPSQVQPYCVSTRVVVQEIRLVQNLKLLHFAPSIQIVFCIKIL